MLAEIEGALDALEAAVGEFEPERYEQIRRSRYLRHWTDRDGAVRFDARLTPDSGARLLAAVDAHKFRIVEQARKAGVRERFDAYAADALVALAGGAAGEAAV